MLYYITKRYDVIAASLWLQGTLTPITTSFESGLKIKTTGMHTSSLFPSWLEKHTKIRYTKYIASHSSILLETVKFKQLLLACTITLKLHSVLLLCNSSGTDKKGPMVYKGKRTKTRLS